MRYAMTVAALALLPAAAPAELVHDSVACARAGKFPRLEAALTGAPVARARVFFRAKGSPHWYAVAMAPTREGRLVGVLPRPEKGLEAFEYYIEVTDTAMTASRTPDQSVVVGTGPADCRGGVMAIGVDSASVSLEAPAGAPSVPSGFSSAGLSAAGSAASTTAAAGGGATKAVLIGVGLAAAGAGIAATAGGGDDGDGSDGANGGGNGGGNNGGGTGPGTTTPGTQPSGPTVVAVTVSTPVNAPVPFTAQFQGRSVSSGGEMVRLEATTPPGAYDVVVSAAATTTVFFGFHPGAGTGPGGVVLDSWQPSAPITITTPPCGFGVGPAASVTVRFQVATSGSLCR